MYHFNSCIGVRTVYIFSLCVVSLLSSRFTASVVWCSVVCSKFSKKYGDLLDHLTLWYQQPTGELHYWIQTRASSLPLRKTTSV
jgi:hypothetical protein